MSQQLILKQQQELVVSQILRVYGKQFRQITERYSDGQNGRCALGVIMSYYGWSGKDDSQAASKLLGTLIALRSAGIDKNLLIEMNDSGFTFVVRSDLDLSAILPTSLSGLALNETSAPPQSLPTPPPPASTVNSGENQETDSSDDDSNSDE